MKKRTVITTEKREVWVINDGGIRREIPDQEADVSGYTSESLNVPNQDDPNSAPAEEKER